MYIDKSILMIKNLKQDCTHLDYYISILWTKNHSESLRLIYMHYYLLSQILLGELLISFSKNILRKSIKKTRLNEKSRYLTQKFRPPAWSVL